MKKNKSERLSILSELEEFAFYGFPDFNDEQRLSYFSFEEKEWELVTRCSSLHAQLICAFQIGYFKAKQVFFSFSLSKIPKKDLNFILSNCFLTQALSTLSGSITQYEIYRQRGEICRLFGYKPWSNDFLQILQDRAKMSVKIDIFPNFIALELLDFLKNQKIVRPGYTTLQTVVSSALSQERQRLKNCLAKHLTDLHKQELKHLLKNGQALSGLSALKQDPKNFKFSMMHHEIRKHDTLKPLQILAKDILPLLNISQKNIEHYASLIHHYTVYELERFDEEQRYLYLLCYVLQRYQKVNNNLVDAFTFHVNKLEKETKIKSILNFAANQESVNDQKIGRLLLLYVEEGEKEDIREKAFKILPKESIRTLAEKMIKKPRWKQTFQWQERERSALQYKKNLRPLFLKIHFESQLPNSSLLKSIEWMKEVFAKKQTLSQQPFDDFPQEFISKRLRHYVLAADDNNNATIYPDRFEILVYKQIIKQMETGALYVKDSLKHRPFSHDLVTLKKKKEILKDLRIPWLETPRKKQLNELVKELETLWIQFDHKLKQKEIKHLKYDPVRKEVLWVKPRLLPNETIAEKQTFYNQVPIIDIADVLRFVQEKTGFLSAFTPLQPRYKKQELDQDTMNAVLIAQATGIGNYKMAQTSDVSYPTLVSTYQQYFRLSNLRKSSDILSNKISQLSIFPHHTFDILQALYGAFDGQKFEAITPTARTRYSKKYFRKGRGVVAYTLLSNHVPLQSELIGAHEHESYFMFDLWYKNTSSIQPTILTGDMHSINKANFSVLSWFGADFRPRLTNLKKELGHIYGTKALSRYKKFLVQPVGQINLQLILQEKENIDRIVATLALKELSQSALIKKLCSLPSNNKTRKAIFEFNKLKQSIYILKCLLDPQILVDVHRSQNRVESYNNLHAAIAKVGGRKALLGRTDLEMEISNQCGLLIAKNIIYYNNYMLSSFWEKNPSNKTLKILKKLSPISWQHIHFTGHFTFYDLKRKIDIEKIIENINL